VRLVGPTAAVPRGMRMGMMPIWTGYSVWFTAFPSRAARRALSQHQLVAPRLKTEHVSSAADGTMEVGAAALPCSHLGKQDPPVSSLEPCVGGGS